MTCLPHILPNGGPVIRQFPDHFVCFLTTAAAFILQLFGIGEKLGLNVIAADRLSNLLHGLADGVQKRSARILHEMPTIGNLLSFKQPFCNRLAIYAALLLAQEVYIVSECATASAKYGQAIDTRRA
ncbi:hypothetical protein SAMN02746095_03430 [Acidocella aminolytica 101 = DSM 11237]|uniref:Uncharacterized protein n=1 Tax=Acidocella aminolytica 101 = DSM 11237 TaxID=1120923 RepID=A0A0D6PHG5_9PROT|nr:hypothetical protein [Acidocella aminolytica]GAN81102.1 hypothetical protein Aam_076_007 [Acidocella aminolytica 101 = DSM 11237]SHF48639.1 hypothetical protein SAMN02746095_03430 [Acidocella aminolytica 101 = DSM 11237]